MSTAGETSSACQSTGGGEASCKLPWRGDPRAEDKTRLWKLVAERPEGVNLPYLVRKAFGRETDMDGADAYLARRLVERHPDLFQTDVRDGLTWVEPTIEARRLFHLTTSKQGPRTQDGSGVAVSNAEAMLRRRRTVERDATRGALLGALAAKREATEDRYTALEDRVTGEYLLVPYATRFNSTRRVAETRETFDGVLSGAAEEFERAVMTTLTTDPARFESIEAATEDLMEDLNRLKEWVAYNPAGDAAARPGYRPPTLVVPEFTESGLIHAHVVWFGLGWLTAHAALSGYWAGTRDRGEVVWFDRLVSRGGRWRWADASGPRDAAGREPRAYLGKTLADLHELASASPEEVQEAAGALRGAGEVAAEAGGETAEDGETRACERGRRWWKLALYWATGTRLYTVSPSLRPEREPDGPRGPDGEVLPPVTRYRYVGTARLGEFPAHIQHEATVIPRSSWGGPPPEPPPRSG